MSWRSRWGWLAACVPAAWAIVLGPPADSAAGAAADARPASSSDSGTVIRAVHVGGVLYRYAACLPPGFDPARRWPCVLFLHGSGECGTDLDRPLGVGLMPAVRAHPERWPCVILVPQKPRTDEEWEEHEDLVLAVLADAREAFPLDSDRVALTGMSQGGHGVWMIGARHPGLWCCLAPVAAYGRAVTVAPRVASLPVWAFHGLADDVVDPRDTRRIVEAIQGIRRERGLDPDGPDGARMTLYPGVNHGSWDTAYGEPLLPQWMLSRRRPRRRAPGSRGAAAGARRRLLGTRGSRPHAGSASGVSGR